MGTVGNTFIITTTITGNNDNNNNNNNNNNNDYTELYRWGLQFYKTHIHTL